MQTNLLLDNPLQAFRQILKDNEININGQYEFECSTMTTVAIQEEDFVLPDFKFKVSAENFRLSRKYFGQAGQRRSY